MAVTAFSSSYIDALNRGWSPDNVRGDSRLEELQRIAADPDGFLAALVDREARAGPITMPDGTTVARLPSYRQMDVDGELVGTIRFRWQPGTRGAAAYVLRSYRLHGRAMEARARVRHNRAPAAPARRGRGPRPRRPDRRAAQPRLAARHRSQRGVLLEEFVAPEAYGHKRGLRYRITLRSLIPDPRSDPVSDIFRLTLEV